MAHANMPDSRANRAGELGAGALPPEMPQVDLSMLAANGPPQLAAEERVKHTIGWQARTEAKGGHCFVVVRFTPMGSLKFLGRYPLTTDGWARAWRMLAELDAGAAADAARALAVLAAERSRREELQRLTAQTLVLLRSLVYLGGHVPDDDLAAGQRYDVRFLRDVLTVSPPGAPEAAVRLSYDRIENIEISGPGKVRSGGGFAGGGIGLAGAAEGMAIAALLNALTEKVTIKTVLRIQAASCELFWLSTELEPEPLRIAVSRPLALIRQAAHTAGPDASMDRQGSVTSELHRLADLLDRGLLTREEFDTLKAHILGRL